MGEVSAKRPFEAALMGSLSLKPRFVEYPDNEFERVPYSGKGIALRLGYAIVASESVYLKPYGTVRYGRLVPDVWKDAEGEYETRDDFALSRLDLGGGVGAGLKAGAFGLGVTGGVFASRFHDREPNPNPQVDRYGVPENPDDQGGALLPLQHENAQIEDGFHPSFRAGPEVSAGFVSGKQGPELALILGGTYGSATVATENKGDLHLRDFEFYGGCAVRW